MKHLNTFIMVLMTCLTLLMSQAVQANNTKGKDAILGDWIAHLPVTDEQTHTLIVHIDEFNGLSGTLDSLNAAVFEQSFSKLTWKNNRLMFQIEDWSLHYEGTMSVDGQTVVGTFIEGGFVKELTFKKLNYSQSNDAKTLVGDWQGYTLSKDSKSLKLIVHLTMEGKQLVATADSPDQGAFGMKIDSAAIEQGIFSFDVDKARVNYTGVVTEDAKTIYGIFTQQGDQFGLILKKTQRN